MKQYYKRFNQFIIFKLIVHFLKDIWSFGCVLFEVIELKKAFNGEDFNEIFHKIEYEEIPTINSTFADIMIFNKE